MSRKIKQLRGKEANLPVLDEAQLAFTTDTKKLFVGANNGNIELAKKSELNVVTAQLADKAPLSDVQRLDAQKASEQLVNDLFSKIGDAKPSGAFPTLTDLQTTYPNGDNKNYYVVTSDNNWYYWNGTAWTSGGLFNATVSAEFPATNILPNGNFESGIAGWTATNSTNTSGTNKLVNTANGTATYGIAKRLLTGLIVGHKYYIRAKVKVTNNNADYVRLYGQYASESGKTINTPVQDVINDISTVLTFTNAQSEVYFMQRYADSTTSNGKVMEVSYVSIIDLTETFGIGNEPTAESMDNIMSHYANKYFNGTVSPLLVSREIYNKVDNLAKVALTNDEPVMKQPILQPKVTTTSLGSEISPSIATWTGENGTTWDGSKWTIPSGGTLSSVLGLINGNTYVVTLTLATTNNLDRIKVAIGSQILDVFSGTDGNFTFTFTSDASASTPIVIGDVARNWQGTISNVSVKQVLSYPSIAAKIADTFDVRVSGSNIAHGGGHGKRTGSLEYNAAYGYQSQEQLASGKFNNAYGSRTQQKLVSGNNNNAFGYIAQQKLINGFYNNAFGYATQTNLISGSWNNAFGNEAQMHLTTGDDNIAVGRRTQQYLTEGKGNIAIGKFAAAVKNNSYTNRSITANYQTIVGTESIQSSSVQADYLTTLGYQSEGTSNATALGSKAQAKGVGSVAIGMDSDGDSAVANNQNDFVLGTSKHNVKIQGTLNLARYTPTSSADIRGVVGDITTDDNYIYTKTSTGWKRSTLSTW